MPYSNVNSGWWSPLVEGTSSFDPAASLQVVFFQMRPISRVPAQYPQHGLLSRSVALYGSCGTPCVVRISPSYCLFATIIQTFGREKPARGSQMRPDLL